jgi:hypothetical protein
MIEHTELYQVGFYAPGARKEPDPDTIAVLLDAFRDLAFVPTTLTEFKMMAQPGYPTQRLEPRLQLQLTSTNQQWNVAFEQKRVLVRKVNVIDAVLGGEEEFVGEVINVMAKLLKPFPMIGTRLTFATRGVLGEMSSTNLDAVNRKIFKVIPFYSEHSPHEWSSRNISRIEVVMGGKMETLNVITDVNRIKGTIEETAGPVEIDRIQICFDINTYQGNEDQRFNLEDIQPFLHEALQTRQRILTELEGTLNEQE